MKFKIRKFLISVIGFLLLVLGILLALPGVPGPGLLIAVTGLAILSSEYEWARRQHDKYQRELDKMMNTIKDTVNKGAGGKTKSKK